ncbi:MAG TPA: GatB/YqeY domain-containing protein [Candidatus Moranbacteria bacterium]|nr:GatB/YqeY domain-containing protein [Candidatus Moranbacteria bacterium]
MTLKEQIQTDFKEAFKAREDVRKNTLSTLISEIKNKEIEIGEREKGLSDEGILAVIQTAVKRRRDSIEQFKAGGREDLVANENAELEILEKYLPEQMDESTLEAEVKRILEEVGVQSKAEMGKAIGAVMAQLKGKADGNRVKAMVEKLLQ